MDGEQGAAGARHPEALVLLAAGRSSRFGRPKSVEPLGPGGASLTAYTVFDALRAGFGRVVIVTRPPLRSTLQAHLEEHLGPGLPIEWVFQALQSIPERYRARAGSRSKPWGTGQAILACRTHLRGAFAVANGDDWYGPEAFEALFGALGTLPEDPDCGGVLVGYPMEATLPPSGAGVSRGWVRTRESASVSKASRQGSRARQAVQRVVEMSRVARTGSGGDEEAPLTGIDPEGTRLDLPADAWASMNLWGFGPCFLPLLSGGFESFLDREAASPEAEFALSSAVDGLIGDRSLQLALVPEGRRWFGITHPEDGDWVRARLAALHADGTYPDGLAAATRGLLARLAP